MTIHKIFHIHQSVEETKNRLGHLWNYRHHLPDVEKAYLSQSGEAFFEFQMPGGFTGEVRLERVQGENLNQVLFRSIEGNIEVVGILEFTQVRHNLTEVELTLDYEIQSPLMRSLDRWMHCMDGLLNRQLDAIRSHFQGIAAPHHSSMETLKAA